MVDIIMIYHVMVYQIRIYHDMVDIINTEHHALHSLHILIN